MERDEGPLVSVIVSCCNQEAFVEATIRSVMTQSWRHLEVLVIDDCSQDRSYEILERLAREDPRIKPLRQPRNLGVVAARNAGLAVARGTFIALLDGDDLWTVDALAHRIELATAFPAADLIATDFAHFEEAVPSEPTGRVTAGPRARVAFAECHATGRPVFLADPFALVATLHFAWIGATLVRRSAIDRVGRFDPDFKGPEDTLLWLKLANQGPIVYSPEITAHYRQHARSFTAQNERREYRYLLVLKKVLDLREFERQRGTILRLAAECHHISAMTFRRRRHWRKAVLHASAAVRTRPLSRVYWRETLACLAEPLRRKK